MSTGTPKEDRFVFIGLIAIAVAMGLLLLIVAVFGHGVAE